MRHDQLGLDFGNVLNVIADMPAVRRTRRHRPSIGTGKRYLTVQHIGQRLIHDQKAFDFRAVVRARQALPWSRKLPLVSGIERAFSLCRVRLWSAIPHA